MKTRDMAIVRPEKTDFERENAVAEAVRGLTQATADLVEMSRQAKTSALVSRDYGDIYKAWLDLSELVGREMAQREVA